MPDPQPDTAPPAITMEPINIDGASTTPAGFHDIAHTLRLAASYAYARAQMLDAYPNTPAEVHAFHFAGLLTHLHPELAEHLPDFDPTTLDRSNDPEALDQFSATLHRLAEYANHKAYATHARLLGQINHALAYEATCERIYKRLPTWAQW